MGLLPPIALCALDHLESSMNPRSVQQVWAGRRAVCNQSPDMVEPRAIMMNVESMAEALEQRCRLTRGHSHSAVKHKQATIPHLMPLLPQVVLDPAL